MTTLKKIRGLTVLSFISKCSWGKEIPYGKVCCSGHGKWITNRSYEQNCTKCSRTITLRKHKRKDGSIKSTRPLVHYMNGKMVCHSCKCKEWCSNHKEYMKIYHKIYWYEKGEYFNKMRRIRASIKRGYCVQRMD